MAGGWGGKGIYQRDGWLWGSSAAAAAGTSRSRLAQAGCQEAFTHSTVALRPSAAALCMSAQVQHGSSARISPRQKRLGRAAPGPAPNSTPRGPQGTPRTGIAPSAAPGTHSARHVWRHTKARGTSGLAMLNPSNRAHYAPPYCSLPATHRSPTPPTKKSCSRTTNPNKLPHQQQPRRDVSVLATYSAARTLWPKRPLPFVPSSAAAAPLPPTHNKRRACQTRQWPPAPTPRPQSA